MILIIAGWMCGSAQAEPLDSVPADSYQNETVYSPGSPARTFVAPSGVQLKDNPDHLGVGMERVSVGGVNIAVPKGMRVSKEGSQVTFEDIGEYFARRFEELERHIAALEAEQDELKQTVQELKEKKSAVRDTRNTDNHTQQGG